MSAIHERIKWVISAATNESDRYKTLEEFTGINRTKWQNFMKGKQDASAEMIEGVCRLWEQWMPYMVIGKGPKPEINPEQDTYFEISAVERGVTLTRDRLGNAVANIPHIVNLRAPLEPANFEWGYHGTGPRELAANILFFFRVPEDEARMFATEFSEEVLSFLPHKEAFLSSERIREWIDTRMPELRKKYK